MMAVGFGQLFANFVGSVLSHSDNTVYAVRYAYPNPASICVVS